MSILGNDLLLGSGDEGYNLTRSLRFRSSASASLNRTPASAGNRQKFTLSFWTKRGAFISSDFTMLFYSYASTSDYFGISFDSLARFNIYDALGGLSLTTTPVYRDPSSWYHFVIAIDTTQATAANRVKIYVNSVEVTAWAIQTYPAQNTNLNYNSASIHRIAASDYPSFPRYYDGYLTEVNFIDGQALTPSNFGETDIITGVWKPKRYAGTYGTNGFYLPFTDNSALTTSSNAGLGKDFSGNGNYWTTNNISITSGTTYDSMTDVPTLTSATAANFAVLNPLNAAATLNDGNMNARVTGTGGNYSVSSTIALSSGLIYFETIPYVFSLVNGQIGEFGICYATANLQAVGTRITNSGIGVGFGFGQGSSTWFSRNFGTATNLTGLSGFTTTTVAMVAVNLTTGNIWVGKDGVWYNSGNPATGANPTITGIPTAQYAIGITAYQDTGLAVFQAVNFGQRPFTYTPPTGYVALNTYNLPTSTIVKGNTVMDATTWTGNNSTNAIVNAAAFKPDLIWIKDRSRAGSHVLVDSVRGITKVLSSDGTWSENTYSFSQMSSINSNGFTLTANTTSDNFYVNVNADTFVGWQWQAGQGTTSSNTNGSITSTVSVNASAGFSVVTYTGTGANATVGHGLGVTPSLIICKARSTTGSWQTYHSSIGNTSAVFLNLDSAAFASSVYWNNTSPTSSVFSIGTSSFVNVASQTQVAYCWTPIAGFSSFGSYTGNGSTDGPFVYTNFKPKWVLLKRTDSAADWIIYDAVRNTYNVTNLLLFPDTSGVEETSTVNIIDILSNGFKLRGSAGGTNGSGGTWIYAAFASNPFKNSLAQ